MKRWAGFSERERYKTLLLLVFFFFFFKKKERNAKQTDSGFAHYTASRNTELSVRMTRTSLRSLPPTVFAAAITSGRYIKGCMVAPGNPVSAIHLPLCSLYCAWINALTDCVKPSCPPCSACLGANGWRATRIVQAKCKANPQLMAFNSFLYDAGPRGDFNSD